MMCVSRLTKVAVSFSSLFWTLSAYGDSPQLDDKYCFSGGEAEEQALRRELDRVADQFNIFARGIARNKLHNRVRPYDVIEFDDHGALRARLGDQLSLVCDGKWHKVTGTQGEDGKAWCNLKGSQLKTHSEYDRATRTNTFSFSNGGKSAKMSAVLNSPKLPDTIRFQLSYQGC